MRRGVHYVTHDVRGDSIYVHLNDRPVRGTVRFPRRRRLLDYSNDGTIIGVQFLHVSFGVDASGLPNAEAVERIIHESGLRLRLISRPLSSPP